MKELTYLSLENNTSTQEWEIINLTDEMISSGDLDASNCGILLFVNEYDANSEVLKNQILIQEFNETPSFDIWIANYEDITGTVLLPSLYDWRNEAITIAGSATIYVIDKDEIVNASTLYNYGLVDSPTTNYKILGTGSLSKPLKIVANRFSASAKKIIEQAGGTFEETDPYEKKIRNRKHLRKNQVSKEKITENQEDEKNDEQE